VDPLQHPGNTVRHVDLVLSGHRQQRRQKVTCWLLAG
jgi:hypothetical protein